MPNAVAIESKPTNKILTRNLDSLRRVDSILAESVESAEPLELKATRSGSMTARYTADDGGNVYLHSRYDPQEEAKKFVSGQTFDGPLVVFLHGVGLGHHIKPIQARLPDTGRIAVVEPDPRIIASVLAVHNLSASIADGRIRFLTSFRKEYLHERLAEICTLMMLGTSVVRTPTSGRIEADFHGQAIVELADYVAYVRAQLATTLTISRDTSRNLLANLPTYLANPPINVIKDRFKGYPAIIVAAGPSLNKNIELVREAVDRSAVIAVQSSYKPLLSRNIKPDFVTSLDYNHICTRFFDHIDDFRGVHMIAEPKAHYGVVDMYEGPISLLKNDFLEQILGEIHPFRDGLKAGATVAHLAFYLAEYIGADPIIFIGQDLGFSNGVYYGPGAAIHEEWSVELNRFCTLESREWERIMRRKNNLRTILDIDGQPMETEEMLFAYLQQFERDFANCDRRVIDATEGGARKQGAETMSLRAALDLFASREIPAELRNYDSAAARGKTERLTAARRALAGRKKELGKFEDLCRQTLENLRKMAPLVGKDSKRFNHRLQTINRLRAEVQKLEHIIHFIGRVDQKVEWFRFHHDQTSRTNEKSGWRKARVQLDRDVELCNRLLDGAATFADHLDFGIRRLDDFMKNTAEEHR